MKTRGSAMIIAFFLMAAIGGIAFGIGRIFLLDAAISSLYESGTVAYYAAESGVEEGLLRYRFNQNFVIHADYDSSDLSDRRNLDKGTISMNKLFNGDLIAAHEDSIYGMAAKYKAPIYGDTDNANGTFSRSYFLNGTYGGEGSAFHISRDNSAKIYLSSINGVTKDLNIYLRMTNIAWFNGDGPRLNDSAFIEAKVTGTSAAGTHEYKKILATDGAINPDFNISDQDSIVPLYWISGAPDHNYMTQSRLINLIAGSAILNDTSAELTLKPVGCDIDIALEPIGSVSQVTSPWTTIKSVGYYGDATRTLTAKIDRQSGTVYDLYDFVVYKHN